MRIVLDTGVLIAGVLSPQGPPAAILRALLSGRAALCYDERLLAEYRDVLVRGKSALDPDDVGELLCFLEAAGERILAAPMQFDLGDAADAMFIEVASTGRADYLVTGNVKHFPAKAREGCRVVTPGEMVAELV